MKVDVNTIVFPLPDNELLEVVERSLRVSFPETYRNFIKGNNGAVPITNKFSYNQREYIIEKFLCILNDSESDPINGWYDIEVIITQIGDRLTDNEDLVGMNVVPIAALFSGDFICLDFRETEEPTVVIWFHEESEEFSPVTQSVAHNVSEFFEMLNE
ncbi:SMI1-KNR4 cell-wall [Paenibacillus sp. OK060]|uniref:SUKH superfamily protein n=1 Tax=Paenibacillus pabuli TaxID=1472 RepID=A0ABX9BSM5_9BACL|nr:MULTISPECIES: SMI1/KNR4 family protein [Paenibacillus]RAJ03221.1 SUKH superfamily protein [Paenibacillus pabuli]SDL47117.1 SMI1-KNR4 cell-wall [Paenibacillus sp. OK060]